MPLRRLQPQLLPLECFMGERGPFTFSLLPYTVPVSCPTPWAPEEPAYLINSRECSTAWLLLFPKRFELVSSGDDAGGLNGGPAWQRNCGGEGEATGWAGSRVGAGWGRIMKQLVTPG